MVNEELIKYIRKSLAKGDSIGNIQKKLLKTGWKSLQIEEAIKTINRERNLDHEKNQQKASKIFLIFAGIVIFLSIFLFIYLFSSSPRAISDSDLSGGIYLELSKGDSVEFNLEEKVQVLSVSSIGEDNSNLIVGEPPIYLDLKIDEINEIDLTRDGVLDLKFVLKKIEKRRINLFVQAISEESCEEDWECTEWAVCIGGYKGRVCVDNHYCGTFYEMPSEEEACTSLELNCLDQGGEICTSTYICDLNVTISLDSANCCLGTCELNETSNETA